MLLSLLKATKGGLLKTWPSLESVCRILKFLRRMFLTAML